MSDETYKNTGIRVQVIDEIIYFAKKYNLDKVILFGSRARGDYHMVSDIDIAVSGGDKAEFSLDVDEQTSTLLQYDIVDLDSDIKEELLLSINRDGVIIYEKI